MNDVINVVAILGIVFMVSIGIAMLISASTNGAWPIAIAGGLFVFLGVFVVTHIDQFRP